MIDEENEFQYDSGMTKSSSVSKGKSYSKKRDTSDQDPLTQEAKDAKFAMVRRMAEKMGNPYGSDWKKNQKLLMILGSRGELYIWDQRAEKYEFWNSKDDIYAAIQEFAPDFHAGTNFEERTNEYCFRNFALRCKKIDFHMMGFDSKVFPDELRAEISSLHKTTYQPVYHPDVQAWLQVFGGSYADKLLDWLASYPRLDRPTCLLYICGPKSIGKNLLAVSLARIYGGASDWEDRASDYQSDMGKYPFLWADEEMEKPRRTSIMSTIRRVIGGSSQRINEKQRPAYTMDCYYRVLVTANNNRLLKSWVNLSMDDIDAVRERIGYFYASGDAKDTLEQLALSTNKSVQELTTEFSDFKIAEHVLYLSKHRVLPNASNQRLLVEGWENEVTNKLEYETNESFNFSQVFNAARNQQGCSFLREEGGHYWLNYNNMVSSWEEFSKIRHSDIRWKEMKEFISHLYKNGEKKRMRPTGSGYGSPQHFYKLDNQKLTDLLVNSGMDSDDVGNVIVQESKVEISLTELLSQKQSESKKLEESRIDDMIVSLLDGRDKDAILAVRQSGAYTTSIDLIQNAIKISNTILIIPNIENKEAVIQLATAIKTNSYKKLIEKQGSYHEEEQVGYSGSDTVLPDQGGTDRGGQQESDSTLDSY